MPTKPPLASSSCSLEVTKTMGSLRVPSISITSFQNFNTRYIHGVPMLSVFTSRPRCQLSNPRTFGAKKRSSNSSWMATVGENVESSAVPTSVPVRVAHELLQAGHHYLDVRTAEEFSAGHAVGAVNVPYLFRAGSGMTKNPNFVKEVLAEFRKDDEIIVGCQLGKRSLMAASELISNGFTGITDIAGGYAAWVQNELPTES